MNIEEYYKKQHSRVCKNYQSKHSPFGGREKLADWYVTKLKEQECKCHYCKTSIQDINKLIDTKKLKVRKVRGDGRRGPVLEIDKQGDTYNPNTCVLACYYCNNDKSYTTSGEDYAKYFGENRKKYFDELLRQIPAGSSSYNLSGV